MAIKTDERGFVYDDENPNVWYPPLNLKQLEIFDDMHRYILVHGPRMSGKTFGIVHKVLRHAFDVNGAMVAIVTKTLKNAKSAGVWVILDRFLRIWQDGCPGFRILEGPKTTGDSKMSFVRIQNRWGTVSEIQCHSLEYAEDVEAKFKGAAYSMFWLSEFDQYCNEYAFDILCDALRMAPYVRYEEHQIIADCNPPDSGTNNWIHDKWFKFKDASPSESDVPQDSILKESLHRILVMIDDNPQLDPRARQDLEARYRKRGTLFNRFIRGIWEMDITDGHFSDVWKEDTHVVGNVSGAKEDWEVMVPTAQCKELLTGWDIGESKNHSFHIIEKIINEVQVVNPETEKPERRMIVSFAVLDEMVVIRQFISVEEFVLAAMEKMEYWEAYQKKVNSLPISWRHWSDTSAFQERSSANTNDAAIAYEASRGKIILRGAPKYRDSNKDKVKLIWQLLYEDRLVISAQLFRTRQMFTMLRPDPDSISKYVKRDDHKHPFDSMSYPIIAEAPPDMYRSADIASAKVDMSPHPVFANL